VNVLLAALVAAGIGLPHVLRIEGAAPGVAATIWLGALALRALTVVFSALFVVLYLPTTTLFSLITHWCWHAIVPFVATHLHFNGHLVGDVTLALPTFLLAASLVSVGVGLWRAARQVRTLLRRAVGAGPEQSVVVADRDMLVAAAGIRRPCVVVSAGALLAFDDEELAASLEHERGHIARRHRYLLVLAEICRALARLLPGTRAAVRELVFHLERDADRYAVARRHDPNVLASAICKAAVGAAPSPFTMGLGGGVVTRRIRLLLDPDSGGSPHRGWRLLAAGMVGLVLLSAGTLPSAAHAGLHGAAGAAVEHSCPS
jgi:hypothetical protein